MQGIIIENVSNLYQVEVKNDAGTQNYEALARGRFKKEEMIPVVGDLVEIEVTDQRQKKAVINEILDRKVFLKRPKLANITQLVFVISKKDPKPDLLMLDKQLAFAEFLGIKSLIVCNKTDLEEEEEFKEIKEIYQRIGYDVLETEAKNQKGLEALKKRLKNHTNAFSGNSGVGKSTLINGLFQQMITLEGEISQRNKRGKNTTTSITLYPIDKNTYIADTPRFFYFFY